MKKRWVFLYAVMVCMLLLGCAKKDDKGCRIFCRYGSREKEER